MLAVGPERTFTYAIPSGMVLHPGQPVLVPLLSRRVGGVVFALSDTTEIQGIRAVAGAQHPDPILSPHQLQLARWLSRETRCTLYEAAAVMLPPDFRRRLVRYLSLADSDADTQGGDGSVIAPAEGRVLDLLSRRGRVPQDAVESSLGAGAARSLRRLVRAGLVAEQWELSRQAARPAYSQRLRLAVSEEAAREELEALTKTSVRRRALLEHMLVEVEMDAPQARKEFGDSAVRRLLRSGVLALEERRRVRDPLEGYTPEREAPLSLTAEQADAVGHIVNSLRTGQPHTYLLHGPTGSGKTEVYLRTLAACIAVGKRGMLLAPEISLTPQLVARLQSRFPGRVGAAAQRTDGRAAL